ncbi:TRAP dicarboxylate transporter, DctM subunit [Desulfamplus magnetovallimortis]|uniref:TRAP dicarboxylate transporter, DctM subunit n=1 Tax=Desulfamplus magnetovallimortis TaxID=1246637 RepID=A0A1W1HD21_9BACT|nr:TRAP transporter large permease subunit [Desulfamplus magnetovallimortis]SLM30268.1 TRAP dicarboxylate transporter, DctM subunit [Desulfamplus magnetovallimortis]
MSLEFMTVAMFATLVLAITLGHPLAYTLAAVATLFGLIDNGFSIPMLFDMFANNAWGLMNNYTLVAIPLFILMAQLLDRSKVSEALFESLYVVLGGLKGGLGLAVVVVCTVFAATTGIIGASVVAMGLLATPALMSKGYQKELASGIICASGTLGILIPPSIMMVVFGGLTGMKETSVGNLFAGAILPGMMLASMYFIYIFIRCNINPQLGPPISKAEASKYTAAQKWTMTMKSLVPPLALILAVMGTILAGVATPTEAAGLGASGAMILAFASKKLNMTVLKESAYATLKTTSMVMMLFIGGKFFSTVFLGMGGGDVVADLLIGSGMNKWAILAIMMLIVFFMGMFIDWAAILLVTVPIFMPIAMEIGFDPLWFSMLMCVNLQTSFLTPPFGYALFYFKGVAPEGYTMMHIYKGIMPFVLIQLLSLAILSLFPGIVTWLPGIFFGAS